MLSSATLAEGAYPTQGLVLGSYNQFMKPGGVYNHPDPQSPKSESEEAQRGPEPAETRYHLCRVTVPLSRFLEEASKQCIEKKLR